MRGISTFTGLIKHIIFFAPSEILNKNIPEFLPSIVTAIGVNN
jgi:hypothetical protein